MGWLGWGGIERESNGHCEVESNGDVSALDEHGVGLVMRGANKTKVEKPHRCSLMRHKQTHTHTPTDIHSHIHTHTNTHRHTRAHTDTDTDTDRDTYTHRP